MLCCGRCGQRHPFPWLRRLRRPARDQPPLLTRLELSEVEAVAAGPCHPCVCGEQRVVRWATGPKGGSSLRMRGNSQPKSVRQ